MTHLGILGYVNMVLGLALLIQLAVLMVRRRKPFDFKDVREQQLMTFINQGPADLVDGLGRDLLCIAAVEGYGDLCFIILKNGADPNRLYNQAPLLSMLAASGSPDTYPALALLKFNALPDGPDGIETSPLQACAACDNNDLARLLIDYGANVNFQSPGSGMTPLMTAIDSGAVAVGRELIKNGADLFLSDNTGRQATDYARKKGTAPCLTKHSVAPGKTDPGEDKEHAYREMIRRIHCLMEGSTYTYRPPKPNFKADSDN